MRVGSPQQAAIVKRTRYRDGLLIALLISCPMRLKNLAGLMIGQHLVFGASVMVARLVRLHVGQYELLRQWVEDEARKARYHA